VELVGVYHADGGLLGEARYVVGRLLGTAHCALCDITHSPVRRKREWDALVADLGMPVRLLHLNEMPGDIAAVVADVGSPVVLGRAADGSLRLLLDATALDALDGSVAAFGSALYPALRSAGGAVD
jgi:hypothetical protein